MATTTKAGKPLPALIQRKRNAAARHELRAAMLREEADELERELVEAAA